MHSRNKPQDEREKKLLLTSGSKKRELRCQSGSELDRPIVFHFQCKGLTVLRVDYCLLLSGSGAVAVTLLLIGQMLRVPVQRRQRVREAEFHELHEPGEASSFESSASLE